MKSFGLFATIFLGLTSVGQAQDIVQTAIAVGFDKLVAAIIRAGLTSTLQFTEDLTVFAPTNEAFEALPEGTLDFLFSPEGKADLKDILLYHVIGAPVLSTDLSDGLTATTLNGADVTVTINDDGIFINESQVIQADVIADNGIVHVIDQVLIPPAGPAPTEAPLPNIVEAAVANGFNTLVAAVSFAGLVDALAAPEPLKTVFAPTDEAFAKLPEETLAFLLTEEGKPTLTDILLYHVVAGKALSTDLFDGQEIETLLGPTVTVTIKGKKLFINDSEVILADVEVSNGVIHVIDAVLIPPVEPVPNIVEAAVANGFNTLVAAVQFAELVDALAAPEPLKTVFAPTDEAFAALPEETLAFLLTEEGKPTLTDILLYHVVVGKALSTDLFNNQEVETLLGETVLVTIKEGVIRINDSVVILADVEVSNGVIHVIDAVLIPPSLRPEPTPAPLSNIVETAIVAGFDTLVTAVTFAGLADALAAPEPLKTVFAPTDEAFAALPSDLLAFLLTEEGKSTLADVLLYHVVGAQALSTDLSDGQEIETLLGENVVVSISEDGLFINESEVIQADVLTSNGVIHVIDAVLIPPALRQGLLPNIVETAVAAGFDTLVAAVAFAELVDALSADEPKLTVFAPTDLAFASLPDGILDFLLTEEGKPLLTEILLYHVVGSQVLAADLSDGQVVETLLGEEVVVSIGDVIKINDSVVTTTDILASNGVIHIIDAVLIPSAAASLPAFLPNIVDTAIAAGFDTLVAAVVATDLAGALAAPEPLKTVFAPTNEAFAEIPEDFLAFLLTEDGLPSLVEILLYHVLDTQVLSTDLSDGLTATTLLGEDVTFSFVEDKIFVNESEIIAVDILTSNGVIHVIDAVLIPPGFVILKDIPGTAVDAGFNTLVAALTATDLVEAVAFPNGPFTVFAPTDDAFAALPFGTLQLLLKEDGLPVLTDILLYHVVSGLAFSTDLSDGQQIPTLQGSTVEVSITEDDELFINDSKVVAADVRATNGVIHAIDAVLLFEGVVVPVPTENIVEIAIAAGFDTLVAAVTFAELVDPLVALEPKKTVFAPTNEAFAALPADILGYLLTEIGKPTLVDILLYHVVAEPFFASSITDGLVITTLLEEDVVASITEDGELFINDSKVLVADVIATNGVIHAIDAVLLQDSLFTGDIPGTAVAAGGFDTLVTALTATDLVGAVAFPNGPFTVFAPTDDAFAKFETTVLFQLLAKDGLSHLTDILLYHVAPGAVLLADLKNNQKIETLLGDTVKFRDRKDGPEINDSKIIAADIVTSNGVIHVIDTVLTVPGDDIVPEPVEENVVEVAIAAGFDTLVAAVTFAELVDALEEPEPFKTVFAPTNEAFAALPEDLLAFFLTETGKPTLTDILLYHVVAEPVLSFSLSDGDEVTTLEGSNVVVSIDGDSIKINDSNVVAVDIVTSNSIVHAIDAVLLQEALFTGDIPGTAVAAEIFTTLVAALTATDLVGAVSFPNGPFTVFAPTDDAFAALPFGTVQNLLKEDGLPVLTDILLYHVVSGVALSTDLSDGQQVPTLQGDTVEVSITEDGDLFINDSKVVAADVVTTNGVIHAIDAVLLFPDVAVPVPTLNIVETAIAAGFDTLVAAVTAAELVEALEAPEPIKTVFAPTDEAFAALPEDLLAFLLTPEGKGALTDVLLYHVVGAPIFAADITDGATVTTLLEEDVVASITEDGELFINESKVILADVIASNGVIHAIDAVLIPPGF